MANFSMVVETDELARAIQGVSARVNGVTVAVREMQAAVISAEAAAAEQVSKRVDQGFLL